MGLSNTKPLLRRAISADLELFKMMDETDPDYEELKDHIKRQVQKMIKEEAKKEEVRKPWRELINWLQLIVGLLMAGGFGYWTYQIARGPTSNWWMILTGWMAMAGLGFLVAAFSGPPSEPRPSSANAADAPTSGG